MAVYFIQAGCSTGPVKIGHGDPRSRLADCQVGNHQELNIIRTFEGESLEEATLHVRFADLHIRGEWYNFSRSMLGDVGLTEIVAEDDVVLELDLLRPSRSGILDLPLVGLRLRMHLKVANLSQVDVSRAVGINPAVFSRYCLGQRQIPARAALGISAALSIPLHDLRPDIWAPPSTLSEDVAA